MKQEKPLSPIERVKSEFRENSWLYKFYLWLFRKKKNETNR